MRLKRKPDSVVVRDYDARLEDLHQRHSMYARQIRRALQAKNFQEAADFQRAVDKIERAARRLREGRNILIGLEAIHAKASPIAPRLGERMLLLVLSTKEERANVPGDLEEEFKEIAAKHGVRYAKLWYYRQVAASAWPMVRKAVGWGLLAWVEEWIRRRV